MPLNNKVVILQCNRNLYMQVIHVSIRTSTCESLVLAEVICYVARRYLTIVDVVCHQGVS